LPPVSGEIGDPAAEPGGVRFNIPPEVGGPKLEVDPTQAVRWGGGTGPARPSAIYVDPQTGALRLITVQEGQPYFASSSTSFDGGFKAQGEFYPYYGQQEGDFEQLGVSVLSGPQKGGATVVTPGHLIKWKYFETGGRLQSAPELYNQNYDIQMSTSEPAVMNQWLRDQGATNVYTDMARYLNDNGVQTSTTVIVPRR